MSITALSGDDTGRRVPARRSVSGWSSNFAAGFVPLGAGQPVVLLPYTYVTLMTIGLLRSRREVFPRN